MNGKQLKNSILQWAIQGKLVPQDPNDEPASVLLERIRAEKKRLIKEGKIKKDKNESIIYRGDDNSYYEKFADGRLKCIDEEIPFEIPRSWEWARLNDVCSYIQRGKSPVYSEIKKYPVIAQKCNQWSGFSIDKAQFIAPETVVKYSEDRVLQENDLLWNSTGLGTLGRMAVYSEAKNPYGWAVADSHVTVIRPFQHFMNSFFLYAYFSSPTVQSVIEDKAEGSTKQKELYVDTVKTYLIPVPPNKEQNRIIERIGSVLPIVAKYGHSQDKLDKLNTEINERLRKSVLQEAIQGRLVSHNLNDEPASVLLQCIRVEKQKLLKEGKLKKKDIVDSVIFKGDDNKYYENNGGKTTDINEEIPFPIPDTWCWARLSHVVMINPKNTAPDDVDAGFVPMERINASFISGFSYEIRKWRDIKSAFTHFADGDVAVAKITPCFQNRKSIILRDLPNGIGAGTTEIKVLRPYGKTINREYLLYFLKSAYFVEEASFKGTANQQRILSGYLENKLFPIPPLNEQERIVATIKTCITSTMRK